MVTVISIVRARSMCCLYLDNRDKIWLKVSDTADLHIQEGMSYEEEAFFHDVLLRQYPRALNHAVSYLAARPRSKTEVKNKLRLLHYTEETVEMVVCKLEKENLLNDADFCRQWVHYRLECRYGPRRILAELKLKGIPEPMASLALEASEGKETIVSAFELASKAWRRRKPDEAVSRSRRRIIAQLVRKGYDFDTARAACSAAEKGKSPYDL